MSVKRQIIEIGFDKNGEAEFGVSCDIGDLSIEQMDQLRSMTFCAIGAAQDMFLRQKQSENCASALVQQPDEAPAGHVVGEGGICWCGKRHADHHGDSEEAAFLKAATVKAMSKPAKVWYPCGCTASPGSPKYCPDHPKA